jgi:hypothetical protein
MNDWKKVLYSIFADHKRYSEQTEEISFKTALEDTAYRMCIDEKMNIDQARIYLNKIIYEPEEKHS